MLVSYTNILNPKDDEPEGDHGRSPPPPGHGAHGDTTGETIIGTNGDDLLYSGAGNNRVIGEDGDDILVSDNDQKDLLFGGRGNDHIIFRGEDGRGRAVGGYGDDLYDLTVNNGTGQIHNYDYHGNDTFILRFEEIEVISHGHHLRGDRTTNEVLTNSDEFLFADEFHFVDTANVSSKMIGRFEDFDASRDKLFVEGYEIDLFASDYGVPVHADFDVDVVQYDIQSPLKGSGVRTDTNTDDQQWLLISTSSGGHIFYGLEGPRVDVLGFGDANSGDDEAHFIPPHEIEGINFDKLKDIGYVDTKAYVPLDQTVDLDKLGFVINDYDKNPEDVERVITGSEYGDRIAGGLNDDSIVGHQGNDMIWGGSGDDSISGGDGDDILDGGVAEQFQLRGTLVDGNGGKVFRLYRGTLDRDPDARGFDGWSDRLEKGQYSLTEVVNGFIKSAEFNNKYGNTTNAEFVTLLYNNVLDRNPDDNGLSAWSDRLELGVERADVVRGFTQSQEYIRNSAIDCVTFMSEIYENDTLEGGGGNDTFVFSDRFGSDTITDFNKVGSDVIDLSDVSSISDWSDLKSSHLRTLNGDAAIDAGNANFILLNDVNVNDLTADDFLF